MLTKIRLYQKPIYCLVLLLLLTACINDENQEVPVVNAWLQSQAERDEYRVKAGDTIYSIAWDFGLDYRAIATANGLSPPYHLFTGEMLKMTNESPMPYTIYEHGPQVFAHARTNNSVLIQTPAKVKLNTANFTSKYSYPSENSKQLTQKNEKSEAATINFASSPLSSYISHWLWPTRGKVIEGFSADLAGNHGWNIGGVLGQPILASAAGTVVYSGTGVRGYGNLIIIKHTTSYLSAYAYNQQILVKLGQKVQAGQIIATMGRGENRRAMLHFEIRHNGQPVNPAWLLH